MRDALVEALAIATHDPSVTVVHLRGAGDSFCSGGDLEEFGTRSDPATAHLVRMLASPARSMAEVADRLVAHLHGHAAGSGIELAAFAGRVVATRSTRISLPEVGLGLIPGAGGTVSLPRRIGRHRTLRLALDPGSIDADHRTRLGAGRRGHRLSPDTGRSPDGRPPGRRGGAGCYRAAVAGRPARSGPSPRPRRPCRIPTCGAPAPGKGQHL